MKESVFGQCSGRNDSTSSSCQTWSLQTMKYLFFTYILKASNKMCFRKKFRYRYWKILQYLTGYWYWPQYFSTLSIDIDTAVHFKYRYSLLFLGIGKNNCDIQSSNLHFWGENEIFFSQMRNFEVKIPILKN